MSASISIPNYNNSNRVPGYYFAVDPSKANTGTVNRRVLIVAQMVAGTATPGQAGISAGPADAQAKYGPASQAAHAVARYRGIDNVGELWVLPLADDPAAQKATSTLAFNGPATASGTLSLYVGDRLVPVPVNAGDSAVTVASNFGSLINGDPTFSVAASINLVTGVITLTAVNAGLVGNDLRLGLNVLGTAGGQATPAGVGVAITQPTGGTTNPTALASALAELGDTTFDLIFHAYNDTGSLNAFQNFESDVSGRWEPTNQLFGHVITAMRGTFGAVTAFGVTRNDQHASIMPISDSPSSPLAWAAEIAAQAAITLRNNPAIPLADVALTVMPPSIAGRFIFNQRESLLYDGLSTHRVDDSNTVILERVVTTYQKNALGVADNSYLDIETLLTIQVVIQDFKAFLATQCSRKILVADGTKIPGGSPAITAQIVGAMCGSRYRVQAGNFWVQDVDGFIADLQATNAGNGVVELLLPPRIGNQLRIVAASVQFTKP